MAKTNEQFSNSIEWFEALSQKEMKYDVKLYQLKSRYENCDDRSQFELPCDFNIDFNRLSQSEYEKLPHTFHSFLDQHGHIRAMMTMTSSYVLSTHEENKEYYARCENFMFDSSVYTLYFMTRFPRMDEKTYFILSGMHEMDVEKCTIDFPQQSYNVYWNDMDKIRFYQEYMEGIDLQPLIHYMKSQNIFEEIKTFRMCSFSSLEWKLLCILSERFNVPRDVIKLIHEGKW